MSMDTKNFSDEEFFEPDYSEDMDASEYKDLNVDQFKSMELNGEPCSNSSISSDNCVINYNAILVDSETNSSYNLSDLAPKVESTNDEILEGDGFYYDDDFVEMNDLNKEHVNENTHRKNCEKTLKMAILNKQWKVLGGIFEEVSKFPNLVEQLSFFCADELTSPIEFFGFIKQIKVINYDVVALIGSKLLLNADLCMNHKAGTLILKMMMDENVLFHHLTIKMFDIVDVLKSAVKACIHEKDYPLLCRLHDKSEIFELQANGLHNTPSINKLYDFNLIFKNAVNHLISHRYDASASSQASCCLLLLTLALKQTNFHGRVIDEVISPDTAWFLCEIFIAERLLSELLSILRVFQRFPDLIVWNNAKCNTLINLFLESNIDHISTIAKTFLGILHQNEISPKYSDLNGACKTLTLFSTMSENFMRICVFLFVDSAKKHNANESGEINWTLYLVNKHLTSMEYNEAIRVLNRILRGISSLRFNRVCKVYSVKQFFVIKAKHRPVISNKLKTSNIKTLEKLKAEHNVDKKSNFGKKEKQLPTSHSAHQKSGRMAVTDDPVVSPSTEMRPPPQKDFNKDSLNGLPSNLSYLESNISDPHVEQPAKFQEAKNGRDSSIKNFNGFGEPSPIISNTADWKTFKRLKADICLRLTFHANSDQLSEEDATALLDPLVGRLVQRLERAVNGELIYDDASFEIQSAVDDEIKNMMQK